MGLIAWLSALTVKRPLAWICCLLFACTVFLSSCGGSGSNISTPQIQPQSETIQTPVPRPQTSGTLVPQPSGSPQVVAQPTSEPAAVSDPSPQPQPNQSPGISAPSPTPNPGPVPSPSGSPPTPAPSRTPRPFPTSTLNPGEIPLGAVVISNAAELDGLPLTLGQEIVLTAVAGNEQGREISNQIQWFDQAGELIGRGPSLTYTADQVVMETITARIGGQGSGNSTQLMAVTNDPVAKVSFTVAPEDITVAPGVKVLSDAEEVNVLGLDIAAGILELRSGSGQPTLYVGDVVLGAAGAVPPSRIVGIQPQEGGLRLEFVPALPKEVIERGSATFEQTIDWSGESGEVIFAAIPPELFHIADQLETKWDGFVQAGAPIEKGLEVTAKASLDWKPTYKGSIEFDSNVEENGISHFSIGHTSDISVQIDFKAKGNYEWNNSIIATSFVFHFSEITAYLGPVPIRILISLDGDLGVHPNLTINQREDITFTYRGTAKEFIEYDPEKGWWSSINNLDPVSSSVTINDLSNPSFGYFSLHALPQVKVNILDKVSTQSGFKISIFIVEAPLSSLFINQVDKDDEFLGKVNEVETGIDAYYYSSYLFGQINEWWSDILLGEKIPDQSTNSQFSLSLQRIPESCAQTSPRSDEKAACQVVKSCQDTHADVKRQCDCIRDALSQGGEIVFGRTGVTILTSAITIIQAGDSCQNCTPTPRPRKSCEEEYGFKTCSTLPGYIYASKDDAFRQILNEMRAVGESTAGVFVQGGGGSVAVTGPCVGTIGAAHFNVKRKGQTNNVASIGQCPCCENDRPTRKYAILSRRYQLR